MKRYGFTGLSAFVSSSSLDLSQLHLASDDGVNETSLVNTNGSGCCTTTPATAGAAVAALHVLQEPGLLAPAGPRQFSTYLTNTKVVRRPAIPISAACQVPNCTAQLGEQRDYNRRYKICQHHLKSDLVELATGPHRFCQQCGRMQALDLFDGMKRSCREGLAKHKLLCSERTKKKRFVPGASVDSHTSTKGVSICSPGLQESNPAHAATRMCNSTHPLQRSQSDPAVAAHVHVARGQHAPVASAPRLSTLSRSPSDQLLETPLASHQPIQQKDIVHRFYHPILSLPGQVPPVLDHAPSVGKFSKTLVSQSQHAPHSSLCSWLSENSTHSSRSPGSLEPLQRFQPSAEHIVQQPEPQPHLTRSQTWRGAPCACNHSQMLPPSAPGLVEPAMIPASLARPSSEAGYIPSGSALASTLSGAQDAGVQTRDSEDLDCWEYPQGVSFGNGLSGCMVTQDSRPDGLSCRQQQQQQQPVKLVQQPDNNSCLEGARSGADSHDGTSFETALRLIEQQEQQLQQLRASLILRHKDFYHQGVACAQSPDQGPAQMPRQLQVQSGHMEEWSHHNQAPEESPHLSNIWQEHQGCLNDAAGAREQQMGGQQGGQGPPLESDACLDFFDLSFMADAGSD